MKKTLTFSMLPRTVLILIFLLPSMLPGSFGQDIQGIPSSLKSPQDVEGWLSNFTYQMKIPDAPQTVEETLGSKAGDCDDLAKVVSKALAGIGISSDVVVIKKKGMKIRHAICIWKDKNGHYDFFSNKKLIHTGEKSMEVAIQKRFRLYDSVSILSLEELKVPANEDHADGGRSWGNFMNDRRGAFHSLTKKEMRDSGKTRFPVTPGQPQPDFFSAASVS